MKYMVMECHPAYAVLMDEDSRFVRAANLRYTVGQTVTDPVLMDEPIQKQGITQHRTLRIAAAAACLLILSGVGFGMFRMNRIQLTEDTQSVVILVERTRYEMKLNSSGEVISVQSDDADGKRELNSYDGRHITLSAMMHDILEQSLNDGKISEESPVQVYVPSDNTEQYIDYKTQIENEAAKLSVKAEVKGLIPPENPPAPPAPDPSKEAAPNPEVPAPAPAQENTPQPDSPKKPALPEPDATKPTPPAPDAEKPEPPAPKADKPESPAPETLPAEAEHPHGSGRDAETPHPHEEAPHPDADAPKPDVRPKPKPDAALLPAEAEKTAQPIRPDASPLPDAHPLPT